MVFEGTTECMNVFIVSIPNENEEMIVAVNAIYAIA